MFFGSPGKYLKTSSYNTSKPWNCCFLQTAGSVSFLFKAFSKGWLKEVRLPKAIPNTFPPHFPYQKKDKIKTNRNKQNPPPKKKEKKKNKMHNKQNYLDSSRKVTSSEAGLRARTPRGSHKSVWMPRGGLAVPPLIFYLFFVSAVFMFLLFVFEFCCFLLVLC